MKYINIDEVKTILIQRKDILLKDFYKNFYNEPCTNDIKLKIITYFKDKYGVDVDVYFDNPSICIVPKTSKDLAKIYNLEDYTIVDDKNIVSKIGSFKKENNEWIYVPKKVN